MMRSMHACMPRLLAAAAGQLGVAHCKTGGLQPAGVMESYAIVWTSHDAEIRRVCVCHDAGTLNMTGQQKG